MTAAPFSQARREGESNGISLSNGELFLLADERNGNKHGQCALQSVQLQDAHAGEDDASRAFFAYASDNSVHTTHECMRGGVTTVAEQKMSGVAFTPQC